MLLLMIGVLPAAHAQQSLPEIITFKGKGFAFIPNWQDEDESKHGPLIVYDVVSAWGGGILEADCAKFQVKLKGAEWCFANAANKSRFEKNTTKGGDNSFLPFAGGRCALGMSWGTLLARGDPLSARVIVDDMRNAHLVMHGNVKWWWKFTNKEFGEARRLLLAVSGPRIVPNNEAGGNDGKNVKTN
jgi:YHS domain-containing protein